MNFFGGVEGGASNTVATILNEKGEVLGWGRGKGCNPWDVGKEGSADIIVEAVEEAKAAAGLGPDVVLSGLGLCVGGSDPGMISVFETKYPKIAKRFIIKNDTIGSLATAFESVGVVLISGTGSNCKYVSPDGSITGCGGWGHYLSDEGSAWWIAHRAVKYIFDDDDNLKKSPASLDVVRKLMHEYFEVENNDGMLDHFYYKFKKSTYARFCKVLSESGAAKGDTLCKIIFSEAGQVLADYIVAMLPKAFSDNNGRAVPLQVVCVGSVWNSWSLLKDSFIARLKEKAEGRLKSIELFCLTTSSAVGAALLASKDCGTPLTMNYAENIELLHKELF